MNLQALNVAAPLNISPSTAPTILFVCQRIGAIIRLYDFFSSLKLYSELKTLIINENPHCIFGLGHSEQTVLHDAVESGDLEIVRLVLDTAEKQQLEGRLDKKSFVNLRCEIDVSVVQLSIDLRVILVL